MKFLAVVTPPPAIYHGSFTWKTFWGKNFTPVNMTSCGRRNVCKHREINNSEQYMALDISLKIYCLYKKEVTSSESRYYMRRSGTGLTNYPDLRTKSPNNKQKARISIAEITNQYFRKLLNYFKNSPYLGYKNKQVNDEPTEAYFFLNSLISKLVKS